MTTTGHETTNTQCNASNASGGKMPSKLSDETIARIMMMRGCNYSHNEIAETLGISPNTVSDYVWEFKHESEETSVEETVMNRLSPVASVVIG